MIECPVFSAKLIIYGNSNSFKTAGYIILRYLYSRDEAKKKNTFNSISRFCFTNSWSQCLYPAIQGRNHE